MRRPLSVAPRWPVTRPGNAKQGHPQKGVTLFQRNVRRRPTLPHPLGCSTIGAERLNFRVRDGTGCFPFAMAAVTLVASPPVGCSLPGGGQACCCIQLCCFTCVDFTCGWCVFWCVDASMCLWFWLRVCVTSPRPISTGRLGIAAVHLRPIDPVVCGWPYPIVWVGNLILKCASRLDAFSGYHVRT